ncbi:DNA gyrase subunit A [candidate division LCP-89 bacterium B3_LCP]|uniref:DNA gyrase subunit A n=1 Tax=candidate division LCP-89 bacterium B3_LCP TaxID=2012998 RepID=A0A532V6K0_UNCL8|nr:MAG: DNA gyrase subunit A [candidate division LCP-89 bacterium B3_LCP]
MPGERITAINIEEELRNSYLDYSMSVIVSRALPDVRDGLKPVHRRVLFGMHELGLQPGKAYKKSARIVGDVMGKYHPHGDSAIYDTLVRMAQDFSLRYPLIDGQGNFGSIDGDGAAAMRYTEARMRPMSAEMLADIDKETVEFVPNYDESLQMPSVLPAKIPNLLVNGTSGIAVGMATNIPPHNLHEIVEGLNYVLDRFGENFDEPNWVQDRNTIDDVCEALHLVIPAPDFPTGGIIYGLEGVREAYRTGKGRIIVRARAGIEPGKLRDRIIVTEIPYQVNKSKLIEKIAELVNAKKLEGIADIRDESDRDGMRLVIELKRDVIPGVVLNNLYQHTQLQTTFGVNSVALVNGIPRTLPLPSFLVEYLKHRHEVIVRRTEFELRKAKERLHILEGLRIAVDNIDRVVAIIKQSKSVDVARTALMAEFELSEIQAKAILDMRLARLTGLERQKLLDEIKALQELSVELQQLLDSKERRIELIREELKEIAETYGDERRTNIVSDYREFSVEDMIAEEEMVITISHQGYIKRFPVSGLRRQGRGGKGLTGAKTKDEDWIEHLFVASTHNYLLIFTNKGRCHWLKVHEVPQMGRGSKGRPIVNLVNVERDEKPCAIVSVADFPEDRYIIMATRRGLVKKTALSKYGNPRKVGIIAIDIRDGDELIQAKVTDGNDDVILGTHKGQAIRFQESRVRPMGRKAAGVKGISLRSDDYAIGMVVVKREGTLLVASEKGYGKRSSIQDYRLTNRGGVGIITLRVNERIGKMIAIMEVVDQDDLMIVTAAGMVIRQPIEKIRTIGRATQGVRLIRINENDVIADIAKVVRTDEIELKEGMDNQNGEPPDGQNELFSGNANQEPNSS